MAFRKKAKLILAHKPDILVVPECECPERLIFDARTKKPSQILWFGSNQNKGLGIFSYSNFRLRLLENYNPELKLIIPLEVSNDSFAFNLFAIWANNPADKGFQYVGQIWKALAHYDALFSNNHSVLMGDFNSNTIWDKPKRKGNHSHVVEHLQKLGIDSCYHRYFKQEQGKEKLHTQYMYRHSDKPYHLDYCFASSHFTERLHAVQVGRHKTWSRYSDHTPLIVSFNMNE
jgi:exodeoxyribonuclease-3